MGKMEAIKEPQEQPAQPVLSSRENNLIKELRKIQYGSVTIFIQAGNPVRIEKAIESRVL
ncbi:MAG: DUF2292 domain-containing protein [Dehalococcoidales bacterium]|nr:DUF2292 domain-containing protein [Dehalococcoidales bacterium]